MPLKEKNLRQMSEDQSKDSNNQQPSIETAANSSQPEDNSVTLMKKATQLKLRAKNLFRKIDQEQVAKAFDGQNTTQKLGLTHTGYVADAAFFEILELLKIKLQGIDVDLIRKRFSHPCEARIEYKPALAALTINPNKPLTD
jgi:hypothetical protein